MLEGRQLTEIIQAIVGMYVNVGSRLSPLTIIGKLAPS